MPLRVRRLSEPPGEDACTASCPLVREAGLSTRREGWRWGDRGFCRLDGTRRLILHRQCGVRSGEAPTIFQALPLTTPLSQELPLFFEKYGNGLLRPATPCKRRRIGVRLVSALTYG